MIFSKDSRKFEVWIAIVLSTVTGLVLINRLTYGVDLTDESLYSSLAMAFSRGHRPYIDELLMGQAFAILYTPITAFLDLVKVGTEGIILNFRILYFIALIGLSYYFFKTLLKRGTSVLDATLAALILASFWPFGIPSLSYNTVSILLLNAGLLLLLKDTQERKISLRLPFTLILFALACFSYPSLMAPILLSLVFFGYLSRKNPWSLASKVASTLVTLASLGTAYWLIFIYIGSTRLQELLHFFASFGQYGGGSSKLALIVSQLSDHAYFIGGLLALLGCIYFLRNRLPKTAIAIGIGLGLGLILIPYRHATVPAFHLVISALTLFCLPVVFTRVIKKDFEFWDVLTIISLVTGTVFCWSSSNGISNFGVGATIAIISFTRMFYAGGEASLARRLVFPALAISLLAYLVHFQYTSVYGDGPVQTLTTKISEGPYHGLWTSPEKADFLNQLQTDLRHLETPRSIAFFYAFPAGYLLSNLRISAPTVLAYSFSQAKYDRTVLVKFYQNPANQPDVLVWLKGIPLSAEITLQFQDENDELKALLIPNYHPNTPTDFYTIYRKISR